MNKALAIRILFVLLVLGAIGVRYKSFELRKDRDAFDIKAQLIATLKASSATITETSENSHGVFKDLIYFRLPNCNDDILIMPVSLVRDTAGLFRIRLRAKEANYHQYVIYFGESFPSKNTVVLYAKWAKQITLSIFGQSQFVPVRRALYVAEPKNCPTDGRIDWSKVWTRTEMNQL
jgi:hypothetical protein